MMAEYFFRGGNKKNTGASHLRKLRRCKKILVVYRVTVS